MKENLYERGGRLIEISKREDEEENKEKIKRGGG